MHPATATTRGATAATADRVTPLVRSKGSEIVPGLQTSSALRQLRLAYLRAGRRIGRDWNVKVDVFNLSDREASGIDYYYASRLRTEAGAADDIHFHPVEPRTVRITLTANF